MNPHPPASAPAEPPPPAPADAPLLKMRLARLRLATVSLSWALILLCVAWELWLAPLRPGGSLLVLKVLPLLLAVPLLARQRVRAFQLWSMLILLYLCEGIVRGMSDAGLSAPLGWVEALLAAAIYFLILFYVRTLRQLHPPPPKTKSESGQR